jgi:hypothetical protein
LGEPPPSMVYPYFSINRSIFKKSSVLEGNFAGVVYYSVSYFNGC